MGAESYKVEWKDNPDTRLAGMAPVGGRAARDAATGPLPGVRDPDMGGNFLNKNSGKRGISLNIRHPKGLQIAKDMVRICDVVAEGFSPGVLQRLGLGYDVLKSIRPDIIYIQQSGMGAHGAYGRMRTVGPVAAAFGGQAEMSGLPEPAMPVSWGYSYLDWMGAYGYALALLGAIYHREMTGEGQWIDASQCESGIFLTGATILDWAANDRDLPPLRQPLAVQAGGPARRLSLCGKDRWIAIACFTDDGMAGAGPGRRARRLARRPAFRDARQPATAPGRARRGGRNLDPDAGPLRLHDEIAEGGGAGRGVPERRGPGRYRPATAPPQMADRGYRHQDRHLAGLRDTDEAEPDAGLYRRPDQPRRAVLRRGQHVCADRTARHARRRRSNGSPRRASSDERVERGHPADPGAERMDKTVLGRRQTGMLELQRCQSCGHFQHPPYATCTQCVSTDLKFEKVRGQGAIYAYTIMYHTGDKRFAPAVPYASIIVELDDAPGALMAGNLLGAEYTEAKVGRRVEVVFEKLNDDITLPQFRLAQEEG